LEFGYKFNQPLYPGILPLNLIYLKFDNNFNQPLNPGIIPNSVIYLEFGNNFNQPLKKGDIPQGLRHLVFGRYFNQYIEEGVIPDSVMHITFGSYFNHQLNNIISKNIINLVLSHRYKKLMDNINNLNKFNEYKLDFSFVGYYENEIEYGNLKIHIDKKKYIDKYILENLTEDKLRGKIIFNELVEKIFNPNRLLKMCQIYNMDLENLINNY